MNSIPVSDPLAERQKVLTSFLEFNPPLIYQSLIRTWISSEIDSLIYVNYFYTKMCHLEEVFCVFLYDSQIQCWNF